MKNQLRLPGSAYNDASCKILATNFPRVIIIRYRSGASAFRRIWGYA